MGPRFLLISLIGWGPKMYEDGLTCGPLDLKDALTNACNIFELSF